MPLTFTRNSKQSQVIGHTRITPFGEPVLNERYR
jgi:hypothetical protein